MSLIITADSDGNAHVDNGLHRSSMSLIIAEGSDDDASVENGSYGPAITFITAFRCRQCRCLESLIEIRWITDFSCTL